MPVAAPATTTSARRVFNSFPVVQPPGRRPISEGLRRYGAKVPPPPGGGENPGAQIHVLKERRYPSHAEIAVLARRPDRGRPRPPRPGRPPAGPDAPAHLPRHPVRKPRKVEPEAVTGRPAPRLD